MQVATGYFRQTAGKRGKNVCLIQQNRAAQHISQPALNGQNQTKGYLKLYLRQNSAGLRFR